MALDRMLFEIINSQWSNDFFDALMPLLRNKYLWYPLYVFLISLLFYCFSVKWAWRAVFFLFLAVGLSDIISSQFFKEVIRRQRPCNEIELFNHIEIRSECRQSFSFPSTHASNHFAIAIFFWLLLAPGWRILRWGLLAWAILICYAQIYVGLHYPMDILGGILLGVILSRLIYRNGFNTSGKYAELSSSES